MAHRSFRDADGVPWNAWDVVPQDAARARGRRTGERRGQDIALPGTGAPQRTRPPPGPSPFSSEAVRLDSWTGAGLAGLRISHRKAADHPDSAPVGKPLGCRTGATLSLGSSGSIQRSPALIGLQHQGTLSVRAARRCGRAREFVSQSSAAATNASGRDSRATQAPSMVRHQRVSGPVLSTLTIAANPRRRIRRTAATRRSAVSAAQTE